MIDKVEASIQFAKGQVASIEKVRKRASGCAYDVNGLGVIRVILRPPDLPFSGYTSILKLAPTLLFKDRDDRGCLFEMWYFQKFAEEEIRRVIHALKTNGHLTRHQELEAYLTFDIPYSTEVKS